MTSGKMVLVNGVMTSLESHKASLPDKPAKEPEPLVGVIPEGVKDVDPVDPVDPGKVELTGGLAKLEKMELGELKAFAEGKFDFKKNATKKKMLVLFKEYYENEDTGSSEL